MVAPLEALLPPAGETLTADQVLDRFVTWASAGGFALYPAQEEAILELLERKHVVLNTPTGSGKSLVATALHYDALARGEVSFYTCPIKALVNEKFFALCQAFGSRNVGMLTGDASINREAPILCCTAEILSNLALRERAPRVDAVVMDEFHYYADKERGVAWQIPLLLLTKARFLLMSATLGDVSVIANGLTELSGREVAIVRSAHRPVPLHFEYRETPLHETIDNLLGRRKQPIYLVNFTQRAAAEQAQNLMSVNISNKEEKEQIRVALEGVRFDTPYGKELQRFLRHGIGLHHAGLLPKYRLAVEKLAQQGLLKVISGTDTLGVGVNIPIRTVLFTQLCKFDGQKVGVLSVRDFQQIAGRAGRKGFDDEGFVVAQAPEHVIENIKLEQKSKEGKKVVKRQPPQKGYAHWDKATFERLSTRDPEPLESRFQITHGMLLSLLQSGEGESGRGGYARLVTLVRRLHSSDHVKRQLLKTAALYFRTLRTARIVEVSRAPARVTVSTDLQRDFSLHQTLSLYLLSTLAKLDLASEAYALDVVTLVESIVENPDVVLYAQLHKLKGEKIAEMKADGLEYEERMEKLDELEWPKPNRELIYTTFNAFAAEHPWVGENIRPKSIVREMLETFSSFHDYVRDYGLQRSEGVLLRYISEVYKTLVQTVPEPLRTDELEDMIAHLRQMLRAVDSSLLDEWERMMDPAAAIIALPEEKLAVKRKELSDDPRALSARVRAELHGLLKALADRDWEGAAAKLFDPEHAWAPEKLAAEMEKYFAEHPSVVLTPLARRPHNTLLKRDEPKRWTARQKIIDPEGDEDWMVEAVVDLTKTREPDVPLIELQRIGT